MPPIKQAPSPAKFAREWTESFARAVRQAAGGDKKLSVAEARSLAFVQGPGALFADDAAKLLKGKTVKVDALIAAAHDYAKAIGEKAAEPDGKLSHADASKLPKELKADFAYIRGKGIDELQPAAGDVRRLKEAAQQHIIDNAGLEASKIYPALDSGEQGLSAAFVEKKAGQRLADFLNAYPSKPDAFAKVNFEPSKHALLVVSTSQDETTSFISLMDRASGKVKHLGEIEIVDIPDSMSSEEWAKFFPTLDKDVSSGDDALEALLKGTAKLSLPTR